MAITFTVETGTGSASANSFASVANGDDYHDKHLYATDWTGASTANKQKALMMATRLLDETFDWNGQKASDTQALQWPRLGVTDRGGWAIDGDEIPQDLIDATCELARLLIAADRTAEDDTKGFSRIKAGSLDIEIDKHDRTKTTTPTLVRMVTPHLGVSRVGGTVKLIRT